MSLLCRKFLRCVVGFVVECGSGVWFVGVWSGGLGGGGGVAVEGAGVERALDSTRAISSRVCFDSSRFPALVYLCCFFFESFVLKMFYLVIIPSYSLGLQE